MGPLGFKCYAVTYWATVGQPVLRLGLQLLIKAVTVINRTKAKKIFFIIFLLELKTYYCKNNLCKDNLPMVNGEIQFILPWAPILQLNQPKPSNEYHSFNP